MAVCYNPNRHMTAQTIMLKGTAQPRCLESLLAETEPSKKMKMMIQGQ